LGLLCGLGWKVWQGPRTLEALRPWGPAFEGLPLERCGPAATSAAFEVIAPQLEGHFVGEVELGLLALADRLNQLREVGTAALCQGATLDLSEALEQASSGLKRDLCRQVLGRPLFLSERDFLLHGAEGGRWRLDLGGFDACLADLAQLDLGDRASVEALLGDLDRAYYRLVAVYRALAALGLGSAAPSSRPTAAQQLR
jgi:hypothetical protein